MKSINQFHRSQRGGAGVKFLIILCVILLVANAGYNYVPVAYSGASFKQEMQTAVINGLALTGHIKPVDSVKARLLKAAEDNDLPSDAYIDVKQVGAVVQAQVVYSKQVGILPFGVYTYNYQFNHTATPSGFLLK